jgi:hypothetical protein
MRISSIIKAMVIEAVRFVKRRSTSTRLHGAVFQNAAIFIHVMKPEISQLHETGIMELWKAVDFQRKKTVSDMSLGTGVDEYFMPYFQHNAYKNHGSYIKSFFPQSIDHHSATPHSMLHKFSS